MIREAENRMRLLAIENPISGRMLKTRVRESIYNTTKYEVATEMTSRPGHATELEEKAIKNLK